MAPPCTGAVEHTVRHISCRSEARPSLPHSAPPPPPPLTPLHRPQAFWKISMYDQVPLPGPLGLAAGVCLYQCSLLLTMCFIFPTTPHPSPLLSAQVQNQHVRAGAAAGAAGAHSRAAESARHRHHPRLCRRLYRIRGRHIPGPTSNTALLDHVMLAVGYNYEGAGQWNKYFILKNSWGPQWGEGGYMRIKMENGPFGTCGMLVNRGLYPVVNGDTSPCGGGTCEADESGNGKYTCQCSDQLAPAVNRDDTPTCTIVNVCSILPNNPCAMGQCINIGDGSYSCLCPPTTSPACSPLARPPACLTCQGAQQQLCRARTQCRGGRRVVPSMVSSASPWSSYSFRIRFGMSWVDLYRLNPGINFDTLSSLTASEVVAVLGVGVRVVGVRGAARGAAGSGGVDPAGAGPGSPSGALSRQELPSPQELREWFARRWSRAAGAGGAAAAGGSTSAGGAGATGPGGARTGGTGAAGPTGAPGAGAGGAAGVCATGGTRAGAGVSTGGPAGAGATGRTGAGGAAGVGADAGGAGVVPAGSGGAARPRPYFVPLLEKVLGLPPSSSPAPSLECPLPVQSVSQLQLASPLPAPSPYAGPTGGLAERREPESRPVSPVRTARTSRRVPRPRPPAVPGTHQMTLRPSTAPQRVPLPSPPASTLPALPDPTSDSLRAVSPTDTRLVATVVTDPSFESTAASALVTKLVDFAAHCRLDFATSLVAESASACPPSVGGECALSTDVLEDRLEEFQCFAAALPHLVSTLLVPEGDPDAPDIPTPRSYAEAIEGPYSSQWQAATDAEMASWKSTGTYVDAVPPPGVNIVSGMWIFRVKRPPGSQPAFKARYVARGFTFLQGSLHEEIWLRRPPGFTGSFPPGTQWSLRWPVYGLRQAPREWHVTLTTTLAALGFAPSIADPSLFLCTDTTLPPFYILVYVDDLVFATAVTVGLTHVKSELQKRHTCTDLGELRSYLGLQITRDRAQRTITLTQSHMVQQVLQRFDFTYSSPQATPLSTRHSLSALPSNESVEPSGPYPELVGCLMYLMTCIRPDLAYPMSILACYVAPGRHRPEHMAAAKRVLRYLCSASRLGLVLGGRSPVVLTGHADASWVDDLATQRSSQGYTFSLGSGSVSWRSARSSSVLSSSCEAEIYAGAMAAQELRWLTYLLTDLGEPPRSPPVL
ncbi:unnamed protein product [Closterium sp. NIES-54]